VREGARRVFDTSNDEGALFRLRGDRRVTVHPPEEGSDPSRVDRRDVRGGLLKKEGKTGHSRWRERGVRSVAPLNRSSRNSGRGVERAHFRQSAARSAATCSWQDAELPRAFGNSAELLCVRSGTHNGAFFARGRTIGTARPAGG